MTPQDKMHFTFSDLIAGYVISFDWDRETFLVKTSDDREFAIKLTPTTFAEMLRNLNEDFLDCTGQIKDLLAPGRYLFAYGTFYPEQSDYKFEAKHLVFVGKEAGEFRFLEQDWWINQIRCLADFYLKAEFRGKEIDYRRYRTKLNLEGEETGDYRQETDTLSRLVYGFATAYMLTGDPRYLEAAEKGTLYLREHMRSLDAQKNIVFWYHAIDVKGNAEKKILASEFGDDYDAIPAYEQIYALAGPTQTFKATADPQILKDIEMTLNLFDRYFLDKDKGGYFSHIDPITFDPRAESLGKDRSRKNWNSVGDHAPAYLINAWLAVGEERFKAMLQYTAETIVSRFPDYENSPFVQEKFHEDWSHDLTWGWQQNRAVVGHNLKIAWNLMRINSLVPDEKYVALAKKVAELMPKAGGDRQRGGWYDVVERKLGPGEEFHRFAWHDRKAWWQQEQGILAYLILAGILKDEAYLKLAKESAAFYNAWFLDHDSGGIYFNVLANGLPYLQGAERMKGSHSMSGYHSFELCYLASVYTNFLLTKQHLDLYFKPYPNSLPDNILRVSPDILPPGSVKLDQVWLNGQVHNDFNATALTVKLPQTQVRVEVKVRLVPLQSLERFSSNLEKEGEIIKITLKGILDKTEVPSFQKTLQGAVSLSPPKLILMADELNQISSEGVRAIIFEREKLPLEAKVFVIGARGEVRKLLDNDEFTESITLLDTYDKTKIGS